MKSLGKIMIVTLCIGCCVGCADSRAQRSDEEAMMHYRDCMSRMPPQLNAHDLSGSEHVASASAGAGSRREARQHSECVQQAGWEEK